MIEVVVRVDFGATRGPVVEARRAFATEAEYDAFTAALHRLLKKYPKATARVTADGPEFIDEFVSDPNGVIL